MTESPRQGDIWWGELEEEGRRPFLVVTRSQVAGRLRRVSVAPVTRTVRGIPTEVRLGPDEGLREECVAAFDNLQPIPTWGLTERVGRLDPARRAELYSALRALADC